MLEAERGSIWGGESRSGELGSSLSRLRGEKVGNCVLGEPELSLSEGEARLIACCKWLEGPGMSQGLMSSPDRLPERGLLADVGVCVGDSPCDDCGTEIRSGFLTALSSCLAGWWPVGGGKYRWSLPRGCRGGFSMWTG